MQKKIFFALALFAGGLLNSQTIIIRDNTTREPIENALVTDQNKKVIYTDENGKVNLGDLDKSRALLIYHSAYHTFTINPEQEFREVGMLSKAVTLNEVVFSANRHEEKKSDVPFMIEVIKQKDIEFSNQPNTGDVLANTGHVTLQKSQMGGGSPNIRGFEASRVLIVVDGIRMNNAIYRSGHLQDVMTLDAQMLDRAEIIFGPASTIYGSDALGGVMHFYTKDAKLSTNDTMLLKVNSMLRYASVNNELTGHLDVNLGWKKLASLTNITFSQFGDTRSGTTKLAGYTNKWDRNFYPKRTEQIKNTGTSANPVLVGTGLMIDSLMANSDNNVLVGSGYTQTDIMQRFSILTGTHLKHNINLQASLNPNLPRYDRLANDFVGSKLKWAENKYTQNRLLAAYSINYDGKTSFSDNIRFIAAYQKIDQDRITRRFNNNNRITQMEDVGVTSMNLDLQKKIKERHELSYGAEVTANTVKSTAKTLDIKKDSTFRADTRYAPSSAMNTYAAYISHALEVTPNFVISDGIRFTATDVKCNFTDTLPFKFPFTTISQKSQALTGSIGLTWKEENDYKFSILMNTGFRTPNVDDMSKLFESGPVLIVANPDIKPEYATNFEIGLSKITNKRFKFDLNIFYTVVENYLTLRDFKFNGKDTIVYKGAKLKVQAMQNTDRAYIYGFNSGVHFDFNQNVSLRSTINYIYGRYSDVKNDTVVPLDHIPPVYGQTSVMYKAKNTDVEFFVRYNGKKSLSEYSPSGEDNLAYATTSGMPAWFTVNLRAGYNITKNFRVNAACENITDNRYRVFAGGINGAGRNFIVSLRYKF